MYSVSLLSDLEIGGAMANPVRVAGGVRHQFETVSTLDKQSQSFGKHVGRKGFIDDEFGAS